MLDLNLIKTNPEYVSAALKKKGWDVDFTDLIAKMNMRLELLQRVEGMRAEKNALSASVPQVKKNGGDVQAIFMKVKEISASMAEDE
jgi:seryl-tRNA synthetase